MCHARRRVLPQSHPVIDFEKPVKRALAAH
jgi:hypothetical protein